MCQTQDLDLVFKKPNISRIAGPRIESANNTAVVNSIGDNKELLIKPV